MALPSLRGHAIHFTMSFQGVIVHNLRPSFGSQKERRRRCEEYSVKPFEVGVLDKWEPQYTSSRHVRVRQTSMYECRHVQKRS